MSISMRRKLAQASKIVAALSAPIVPNAWTLSLPALCAQHLRDCCERFALPLPVDAAKPTPAEWEAVAARQQFELTQSVAQLTRQWFPEDVAA